MLKPFLKVINWMVFKNLDVRSCCNVASSKNFNHREKPNLVYNDIDPSKYGHLKQNSNSMEMILKEYEYLKYMTGHVPTDITVEQMSDLLLMTSEYQRKQYLRYLFLTEVRKKKDFLKKKRKKEQYLNFIENRPPRNLGIFDKNGQLTYELWGNSLIGRISSRNLSHIRTAQRLRISSMFGQKLIIDLDYDDHMTLSECRIQVRHIVQLMVENFSKNNEPFDIYFTNCDHQKPTMKHLKKYYHSIPFQMMSLSNNFLTSSYLDVFDRDRLVYLTPNAKEAINDYNHDDIYIIGGFLDKSSLNKPISHLKATREGIRQYRLPLDEHIVWGSGSSKHLCIAHIVSILNEVKVTGNWRQALLDNVPKRKMKHPEIVQEELQRKMGYLKRKLAIENSQI